MEQNPKQQVVERIKSATNILVTVSTNPTVDQLAACIGFTLMLNKIGKHATAVFSGAVPSTLEFLQPEKTLEKNTDSLQDFIIALDKSKADKLRYKVEDDVVRIFITPYRTSLSEKDLEFSLGDFNVDVVVALGVLNKEEIDQAIVMHGRILHDAVVMTVTDGETASSVGSVNWHEPASSSLSEMLVSISESFQSGLLDPQMATAFLTGIVSETERFSNDKTSPKVMTMSAQLMAAGANQQLIATKLTPPPPEPEPAPEPELAPPVEVYEEPKDEAAKPEEEVKPEEQQAPETEPEPEPPKNDGEIEIPHEVNHNEIGEGIISTHEEPEDDGQIHIDDDGNLKLQAEMRAAEEAKKAADALAAATPTVPTENSALLSADEPQQEPGFLATDTTRKVIAPLSAQPYDPLLPDAPTDAPAESPLSLPAVQTETEAPAPAPDVPQAPQAPDQPIFDLSDVTAPAADETLDQLEHDVDSPHVTAAPDTSVVDAARQAVASANLDVPPRPEATQSLGAQHLDLSQPEAPSSLAPANTMPAVADILQATGSGDLVQPNDAPVPTAPVEDPLAPPPVPPPMTAPYFEPKTSHHNPYLNPDHKPTDKKDDENAPL